MALDTAEHSSPVVADKDTAGTVAHGWLVLGFVREVYLSMPGLGERDAVNEQCTSTDPEHTCDR